jgi:hypothetical protein
LGGSSFALQSAFAEPGADADADNYNFAQQSIWS